MTTRSEKAADIFANVCGVYGVLVYIAIGAVSMAKILWGG